MAASPLLGELWKVKVPLATPAWGGQVSGQPPCLVTPAGARETGPWGGGVDTARRPGERPVSDLDTAGTVRFGAPRGGRQAPGRALQEAPRERLGTRLPSERLLCSSHSAPVRNCSGRQGHGGGRGAPAPPPAQRRRRPEHPADRPQRRARRAGPQAPRGCQRMTPAAASATSQSSAR